MDDRVEANRRMWDERVAIHVASLFYDVEGWKAGRAPHLVAPFEADEHPCLVWRHSPEMVQGDDEMWRLPGDPAPLSFSLRARAS